MYVSSASFMIFLETFKYALKFLIEILMMYISTYLSHLLMQFLQKRCPHVVCNGSLKTRRQIGQSYFSSLMMKSKSYPSSRPESPSPEVKLPELTGDEWRGSLVYSQRPDDKGRSDVIFCTTCNTRSSWNPFSVHASLLSFLLAENIKHGKALLSWACKAVLLIEQELQNKS